MKRIVIAALAAIVAMPVAQAQALNHQRVVEVVQDASGGSYVMPTLVVVLAALLVIAGLARMPVRQS